MWRDGCVLWPAGSDRIVPQEVRLQPERGPLPGRVCRVLAKARKTTQVPLHECIIANDQCCGSASPWCGSDLTYHLDADPDYLFFIYSRNTVNDPSFSRRKPCLPRLGDNMSVGTVGTAPTLPLITITWAHIFRRFYSQLPQVYTWGISAKLPRVPQEKIICGQRKGCHLSTLPYGYLRLVWEGVPHNSYKPGGWQCVCLQQEAKWLKTTKVPYLPVQYI